MERYSFSHGGSRVKGQGNRKAFAQWISLLIFYLCDYNELDHQRCKIEWLVKDKGNDLKCGDVRQTEMVDTWGVVQGMGNDIHAALLTLGLPAFGVIIKRKGLCLPLVYQMSPHMTKTSRPSPFVFAYCRWEWHGKRLLMTGRIHTSGRKKFALNHPSCPQSAQQKLKCAVTKTVKFKLNLV